MTSKQRPSGTSSEGLVRGIRRWDLVAMAINAIIGAGIFGLPAKAFALIGSYSLIAFIACALVVLLIILCFAEVGSRFDETGGPYLYARAAFGTTVGFEVGWLTWLVRLFAFAANCNLLVAYLGFFWPAATNPLPRAVVIIFVVSSLGVINLLGVRQAAIFTNIFTVGKLLPMIVFVAVGLIFINPQAFALTQRPSSGAFSQAVLLLVYAFTGFEMATIPAGEIRHPQRDLPRALLIATAVVAAIYILIQVVCIGTLPELAKSTKPLADAGQRFMGTAGGAMISAGAMISIAGNLNILLLAGSRLIFAFGERQQLPAFVARVHPRFFTPHVAITLTAAVMLVLTLNTSFVAAVTISVIARLAAYAVTCAALPVLRRRKDVAAAMFTVPGGPVIAVAALILSAWLLIHSTLIEAVQAAIAATLGLVIFLAYRFLRTQFTENKRHARP
ncbi:MAG TPA: amino acid permease [Pyrinomonadaceae bacterium]|nr:amino acid permease [Pyrinomonadaceae bacterium]